MKKLLRCWPTCLHLLAACDYISSLAYPIQLRRSLSVSQKSLILHKTYIRYNASSKRYSFLQDVFGKAFENDSTLSKDKSQGQLEGPGDSQDPTTAESRTLTETQEKWQRLQQSSSAIELRGKSIEMDFFLTGVPNKDPSSDLFGSRINISTRDRKVGLSLPEKPTVAGIQLEFIDESKCRCQTESAFTIQNSLGDWKFSDDNAISSNRLVRFRIFVKGFTRTVETRGTIQKVYWSKEDERTRQTSTMYSIPEGWLYGEASLSRTPRGDILWKDGILKIEKQQGFLGAASTLVACGKFNVRFVGEQN